MKKQVLLLTLMIVGIFNYNVAAASNYCTFQAAVGSFTPSNSIFYAQLINAQNNKVLTTIGPLDSNGSNYKNINNCPVGNVYAVYTLQSNGDKYQTNKVFLGGNGHWLYGNLGGNGDATLKVEFMK